MRYITYCGVLLFLALLSAQDIKEKQISVKKVIGSGALALICRIMPGNGQAAAGIIGSLLPGLFLILLAVVSKEKIGAGDGMTVMVLGLWLGGWQTLWILCIAIMLAGIFAAVCLVKKRKEPIPFIPFLLLGMEVLLFYG